MPHTTEPDNNPSDARPTASLADLRVLDLSTFVAGPSGTMTLAQLGAEVIRIDPVGGSSDARRLPTDAEGNSLYWAGLNRSKRSVQVDLRHVEGQALVHSLLSNAGAGAAVVVTNRVGQAWLSYEELSKVREDLILVEISGRPDGRPAVDYTINCEIGLPYLTGPADVDQPVNHVLPAWDLLAGLYIAVAVLVAERARRLDGKGRHIRLALSDVAVTTMANLGFLADATLNEAPRRREGNYLYGSFGRDFETSDRERVMIVALSRRHWRALMELTGVGPSVTGLEATLHVDFRREEVRYEYRELLAALISPWFVSLSVQEVGDALTAAGIPWGLYRRVEDMVADKSGLISGSGLFHQVHHPGIGLVPTPDSPLRDLGANVHSRSAPIPGSDTEAVLRQLLDLDDGAVEELRARGVLGASTASEVSNQAAEVYEATEPI